MKRALDLASAAFRAGEVPVGAVVVRDEVVIGAGQNRREELSDPTAHAEILALRQAARTLGGWRLSGATLYVTLEPCPMCAGALVQARLARVVFGARDPKAGAVETLYQIAADPRLNHRLLVTGGVEEAAAGDLLRQFFQHRRG